MCAVFLFTKFTKPVILIMLGIFLPLEFKPICYLTLSVKHLLSKFISMHVEQ